MAVRSKDAGATIGRALEPILEPILEYGHGISACTDPDELVTRIVGDKIDIGALVKFMIASVVLVALSTSLFPTRTFAGLHSVPILEETLYILALVATETMNVLVVFFPLRWAGGIGSFRHTFIASLYSGSLLMPLYFLVDGLMWQFASATLPSYASLLGFAFFIRLASGIHRISFGRAAAACIATFIVVGLAVGLLV